MPILELRTSVSAPLQRVFDLARSIDLHAESMADHREVAVAGVTSGLIGIDGWVTWRARHFLVPFALTSRVVAFDPPRHFRDVMVSGPFARFSHDHHFDAAGDDTVMRDVFDYQAPFGALGTLADGLFLRRHMVRLLEARNAAVKRVAESTNWRRYLDHGMKSS